MSNEPKKMIYFPSLSAGSYRSYIGRNIKFEGDTTIKFYDNEYPEKWRYPYFLLTAGHLYKKDNAREEFGLDPKTTFVFGDSGGYQIATGALKYDKNERERIFKWLENNSDIAANLDIPPRAKYEGQFHTCADLSFDNFKYFEQNQTGKTKFLNVLQGSNHGEYVWWYDKFKDFEFNGWCIGGPQKLVDFMWALALMLNRREFEKAHVQYVHFLGISKVSDFFILQTVQKLMNKYFDNRIVITTDSSSPGRYPIFGNYIHSYSTKTLKYCYAYLPKGSQDIEDFDPAVKLPCAIDCPACKDFTWGMIDRYNEEAIPRMIVHNTHMFQKLMYEAGDICKAHREVAEYIVTGDLRAILKSIHEMFADPDAVFDIYERYKQYYYQFGKDSVSSMDQTSFNKFFK